MTERIEHVKKLSEIIREKIPDAISVTGGMGAKKTREKLQTISGASTEKPLTIVATGRFIGEGFDEPRLDTLFLAMPISWKGTLQQYAGRLHRMFEGKNEVRIFDYICLAAIFFLIFNSCSDDHELEIQPVFDDTQEQLNEFISEKKQ